MTQTDHFKPENSPDAAEHLPNELTDLAAQLMDFSRARLASELPYLDRAFFRMPISCDEDIKAFGTNGNWIRYSPLHVLASEKKAPGSCGRAILHMVLHCLFRHLFSDDMAGGALWGLACDMAVEDVILDMGLASLASPDDLRKRSALGTVRDEIGYLTADRIYHYFLEHPEAAEAALKHEELFHCDEHAFWALRDEPEEQRAGRKDQKTAATDNAENIEDDGAGTEGPHEGKGAKGGSDDWERMGQEAHANMDSLVRGRGSGISSMLTNLDAVTHERENYSEFLKKFTLFDEELRVNDDEFDYIYYTYGLDLYDDMPLIEPLEYREENRIREFVVAIDTSCSCRGHVVRNFLKKTYAILKSGNNFFEKFNLHIIQCDNRIQKDVKVTTDEEFERYMSNVEISGYGGTDFRPVFEHVDGLIRDGELKKLRGLLYFTDCRGTFPAQMPEYKTAFISIYEGTPIPKAPAWVFPSPGT